MMQNLASKPNISWSTITDVVIITGFLYFSHFLLKLTAVSCFIAAGLNVSRYGHTTTFLREAGRHFIF